MFEVGDVVEYIGDVEAQPKSELVMYSWYPPSYREGLSVVESVRLADPEETPLRDECEVYRIYVRGTILVRTRTYRCVIHVTDMYWDFELRKV